MNNQDHIATIAQYLDGTMSPEERAAFEANMQAEPKLAEEVRVLQALRDDSSAYYRKQALVEEIAAQNATLVKRPVWRQPVFRYGLALAAVLALIIAIRPLLITNKPIEYQALFDQYFEAYDESGLITERGESTNDSLWSQAGDTYRRGNYADAVGMFMNLVETDSTDIAARFYLANSLLGNKAGSKAIPHLKIIVEKNDFLFGAQAKWLLALAYIQVEKAPQAIPYLEELSKQSNSIGKKATELLEAMELSNEN